MAAAMLIHLNGVTGVGKSSIARGLVASRPLALNLDIDSIRANLGRWRELDESKHVARRLGFGLADEHLRSGYDVVVPQLVVRADVVDQLGHVASSAGAAFIEVMLVADPDEILRRTRESHRRDGEVHPRDLFSMDELEDQLDHAMTALEKLTAARNWVRVVDVSGLSTSQAVSAVEEVLPPARH